MQYPEALRWSGTKETTFRNGTFVMKNTNRLLTRFAGRHRPEDRPHLGGGLLAHGERHARRPDAAGGRARRCPRAQASLRRRGEAARRRVRPLPGAGGGAAGVPVGTVPVTGGVEGSVKALPAARSPAGRAARRRAPARDRAAHPARGRRAGAAAQQPLGELVVRRGAERARARPAGRRRAASTRRLARLAVAERPRRRSGALSRAGPAPSGEHQQTEVVTSAAAHARAAAVRPPSRHRSAAPGA